MKTSYDSLDELLEAVTSEELEFWSKYTIKGLGQFYQDFWGECPTALASPHGF